MESISADVLALEDLSLQDWPRLERLKEAHFAAKAEVCLELARNTTAFFKDLETVGSGNGGRAADSPELTAGRLYRFVMGQKAAIIADESLLAGTTTTKEKGVLLYPHFMALAIWPELETIGQRSKNPFVLNEADWKELNSTIFPFWMDGTIEEIARKTYGQGGSTPECQRVMERIVFYLASKVYTISHTIPDYGTVLARGLQSMIDEAAQKESALGNGEGDGARKDFYRAVQLGLSGIIDYANRLADEADRRAGEAETSGDLTRAQELRTMEGYLKRVPAEAPRTLQEAINALWICKVALHQENANAALSVGRLDQILYPFYRKDVDEGRITPRQAFELVGCLWLKMADHLPVVPEASEELFGGTGSNQAVTLGGVKPDGQDAVNDLTYVMLHVTQLLKLRDPNVNCRYHPTANETDYRDRLARLNLETRATPCYHNDMAVVEMLKTQGVTEEHARDYGIVGCVEPTSSGRTFGATGMCLLNLTSVLELTLFAGRHRLTGISTDDPVWHASPPPASMGSFEAFKAAFTANLDWLVGLAVQFNNDLGLVHQKVHPTPLLSAMMDGCMEKGMDVIDGGARYNSTGVAVIGLADVVDSVCAMEQFVFGNGAQGAIPVSGMIEAITTNWGAEEEDPAKAMLYRTYHEKVKTSPDKFGYDESEMAMRNAKWVVDLLHDQFQGRKNYRGGPYTVGYWTMTNHAGFGVLTSALPSGRTKGKTFASGITPVEGTAPGLPSCLAFVGGLDRTLHTVNGHALNLKFTPPDSEKVKRDAFLGQFTSYLDAYFKDYGGIQVQCNVIGRDDLWKWHKNPAECPTDALVRVSGYTAYFGDLNPHMQREIILRAEYNMESGTEVWDGWTHAPIEASPPSGKRDNNAAELARVFSIGLSPVAGWLLGSAAEVVLLGLFDWMQLQLLRGEFRSLLGDFRGLLLFSTKDGRVHRYAEFHDGTMHHEGNADRKPDVTITFADGRALVNFLFSPLRDRLNALAAGEVGGPPAFDILASMVKNEVTVDGNLNYLYRFGFLANHLLLEAFGGLDPVG